MDSSLFPTGRPRRPRADGAAQVLLSGLVERVTFHNAESGFTVLRVAVAGRRGLTTVVAHVATISAGEHVQATGEWVTDRTHGLQFRASWLRSAPPTSVEAIERYLGSGLIRGIGPHLARRLVESFGARVFDVIEQDPGRLRDVEGVGPVRGSRIVEGWRAQKAVREIMLFLHAHGVGTSRAARIYKTYGVNAIAVITENPYQLARDIRGIGFASADRVAERLGLARDAPVRVRAGVGYALLRALDEGHCGLPRDELVPKAAALLGVDERLVDEATDTEIREGRLVATTMAGRPSVFLPALFEAERRVAARVRALAAGRPPWPDIDPGNALPWVEGKLGLTLADSQRQALTLALTSKLLVVTGGPGVGKTTLLNAMLTVLRVKGVRPLVCAPTGRAAKRSSEATGLEAKTIHRLLEVSPRDGRFRRDAAHPLDGDLVVVDEVSMLDVALLAALLDAVPDRAAIWLVGDADQLPSVGPGQVLADLLTSEAVPVARLTHVFRQAADSRIIDAAHRINRGELPDLSARQGDFVFVEVADPTAAARRVVELVATELPRRLGVGAVRDIQVLSPMNRGDVGTRSLNAALQQALNPTPPALVERFGSRYGVGDKVMQIENDYERDVYNGDVGVVARVDHELSELDVGFDGRRVTYGFDDLDRLVLAYASTVHKAQGAEYPVVVVPVTTQHYVMLERRLLYTAVTRARRALVVVGQARAVAIAVRGRGERRRWSRLAELLAAARQG
jgi:exodeoxyribonuclease V alpha subunit